MKAWTKLPDREKDGYTVVFCLALVMAYIFLAYAPLRTELQTTENMINRRINRTETRASATAPPSVSTRSLQRELAEKSSELEAIRAAMAVAGPRFAALDVVDEVKALRLEVAAVADFTGVTLRKFGDLKETRGENAVDVLLEETRNPYERPVFQMEAEAEFTRLYAFLERLSQLSKSVSVVRMEIEAPGFDDPDADRRGPPQLVAKLELAF
ncbi:MAG: hypothetical protein AAGI51_00980 [Pseudomonadota bacterium]